MKRPNKPKNKQYSSNLVYNYFAAERIFEAKIEAVEVIRLCVEAKIVINPENENFQPF